MPAYDFSNLSPVDFEDLVRDLLQAEHGVFFESFANGRDGGIDLRHSMARRKEMIVQCKKFARTAFPQLLSHLKSSELPKIKKLKPARYLLVTSVDLTPARKAKIKKVLGKYCTSTSDILGLKDVNNLLGRHAEIERNHYKLWLTSSAVLERLLHNSVYTRSKHTIDEIRRKLRFYVQNKSFPEAQNTLRDNHYCVIAGIPGIGKTTLAEILIASYLEQDFELICISEDIEEALRCHKPENKQIFYYDDFLGQTAFTEKLAKNEDGRLIQFIRMVSSSPNSRFILTTREYILNQAKALYEKLATSGFDFNKCVINLADYTRYHRARIFYNHLHFSELPRTYVKALVSEKNYLAIINHPHYSPRIIETMTLQLNTAKIKAADYPAEFKNSLDNPARIWELPFEQHLSAPSRTLVIALASLPAEVWVSDLKSAFEQLHSIRTLKYGSPRDDRDFKSSLRELEASFITITASPKGGPIASFHNPGIRDFLEDYLKRNSEVVETILDGALFYSQAARVWSIYLQSKTPWTATMKSKLLAAIERTALKPDCVLEFAWDPKTGAHKVHEEFSLESRLASVVSIGSIVDLKLFEPLIASYANSLSALLELGTELDKAELLKAFRAASDTDVDKHLQIAFGSRAKALFLDSSTLRDYDQYLDFLELVPENGVQPSEHDAMKDKYQAACLKLTTDYDSEDGILGLEEDADLINTLSERFQIDTAKEEQALRDRVADRAARDRLRVDEEPSERSFDVKNEESEIERLFSSLE